MKEEGWIKVYRKLMDSPVFIKAEILKSLGSGSRSGADLPIGRVCEKWHPDAEAYN